MLQAISNILIINGKQATNKEKQKYEQMNTQIKN